MPRENTTQGISFPPQLLAQPKQQAATKGPSVSGYVQALIRDDLSQPDMRLTREVQEKILLRLQELDQRRVAERPAARKKTPANSRARG
ncbi:MAG: hypothetical protein ACKOTF_17535 [Opitutaceae bacterium]